MTCRVPFSFLLTTFTLFAALVPAVVIWAIMYTTINDSMDIVTHVSTSTITELSSSLQTLLITDVLASFATNLQDASTEVQSLMVLLMTKGMDKRDLSPSPTLSPAIYSDFGKEAFSCIKTHQYFSFIDFEWGEGYSFVNKSQPRSGWMIWQALNIDIGTNTLQRAIYLSLLATNVYRNQSALSTYYPNQTTVNPLYLMEVQTLPASQFNRRVQLRTGWLTDIVFSQYNGQAELYYDTRSYLAANDTYYDMALALNTQTISQDLKSKVANNSQDRLFIIFRQPHGHMLGASHGKFYSQSDVDSRTINPLTNPPNMSLLWAYTCFDSNDPIIVAACGRLYALAGNNWSNVPQVDMEMVLLGAVYWVSTGFSSDGLDCTMVALKYKAAIMGPVDEQIDNATNDISRKKTWTYAVLGIATFFAILMPLLIGWWLASRLAELGDRLRSAEKLNLSGRATAYSFVTELHGVQDACNRMEQGLARLLPASAGQRQIMVWSDEQSGQAADASCAAHRDL
eukprot:EG_transcript_4035